MDTIKKDLVDQSRAEQIFPRVKTRLSKELIKTDEKYVDLLIDELNQYFVDISSSTINSNDLPDNKSGPISKKHNKVLINIASDIDKVHNKRTQVQDVISKAVNYLSTERVSLNNAVSKMYARVVNKKLRSSMNDRHLTVFSEYFNDSQFIDIKTSNNIEVDVALSALTLTTIKKYDDNSDMIDQDSIYMYADLTDSSDVLNNCIYPICNQPIGTGNLSVDGGKYFAGFGRTLSMDPIDSSKELLLGAGPLYTAQLANTWHNIQGQALTIGTTNVTNSDDTTCEFEFILNDFNSNNNIKNSIITSIKNAKFHSALYNIETEHIIIDDKNTGFNSFNGSHTTKDKDTSDKNLITKINNINLTFNLKSNAVMTGNLSQIRLSFSSSYTNLKSSVDIDFYNSYVIDESGVPIYCFQGMITPKDSKGNSITDERLLLLDTPINKPKSVCIAFKSSSFIPTPITNYIGACWMVQVPMNTYKAKVSYGYINADYNHSSNKFLYVYHDIQRNKPGASVNLNEQVVNSIISNIG